MICDKCGAEMVERMATRAAPYRYDLGGCWLLSGIRVYRCSQCRAEAPVIPRITELHRLMAKTIAAKPATLTGEEVQFLRKHAGLSSKACAEALSFTPTHFSHIENGSTKIGGAADRLIRVLGTDMPDPKDALIKLAAAMRSSAKAPSRREMVRGKDGRWEAA